ncbi:MAG: universal stress protein [Pseudomonadales bacterium]
MKNIDNILFAVTAGQQSTAPLERAVSLAENNQARLTVVDVLRPLPPRLHVPGGVDNLQAAMVAERLQELQSLTAPYQQRLHIEHEVQVGTSFLEIIRTVLRGGHDLLVKPVENPSVVQRLFGSDDMHLLRKCPCPVWLTRPEARLLGAGRRP